MSTVPVASISPAADAPQVVEIAPAEEVAKWFRDAPVSWVRDLSDILYQLGIQLTLEIAPPIYPQPMMIQSGKEGNGEREGSHGYE
jgi:hypothetical protein